MQITQTKSEDGRNTYTHVAPSNDVDKDIIVYITRNKINQIIEARCGLADWKNAIDVTCNDNGIIHCVIQIKNDKDTEENIVVEGMMTRYGDINFNRYPITKQCLSLNYNQNFEIKYENRINKTY